MEAGIRCMTGYVLVRNTYMVAGVRCMTGYILVKNTVMEVYKRSIFPLVIPFLFSMVNVKFGAYTIDPCVLISIALTLEPVVGRTRYPEKQGQSGI